jgi:hypothetical protein
MFKVALNKYTTHNKVKIKSTALLSFHQIDVVTFLGAVLIEYPDGSRV